MLAEFGISHMGYYTPHDEEYFELLDIFKESDLAPQIAKFFPSLDISYAGIGAKTLEVSADRLVHSVLEGSVADRAGLKCGDRVISADGLPFHPIDSFLGKEGKSVLLAVRRSSEMELLSVVPEAIRPGRAYYVAMQRSIKTLVRNALTIGYIHIWSYAGQDFHDLLLSEMAFGAFRDVDALLIDLRDGLGGASEEYLDVFRKEVRFRSTTGLADSEVRVRWSKPTVLVVDGTTRSGKEVFAYLFQQRKLGKVVGSKTAGHVMFGRPFLLADGTVLYVAVREHAVNGVKLEGRGVVPDVMVDVTNQPVSATDPLIASALDIAANACI